MKSERKETKNISCPIVVHFISKISIYHNCIKVQEVNVTKEPEELIFESASTFYLAQAGNSKEKFEVRKCSVNLRSTLIEICHRHACL